jgi:hypothetical protein
MVLKQAERIWIFEMALIFCANNDESVLFGILILRDIRFTDLRDYISGNSRSIISIAERVFHRLV